MSRIVTSLCGVPSFGTFGTPTFFGGAVGASSSDVALTDDQLDALGDRSLITPGATIPAVGSPDRASYFVQLKDSAVHFDAAAVVHAVPRHADTGTWSLSFWIGFGLTDVAQGTIFRIGDYANTYVKGSGAPFVNDDYFEIAWRPNAISISNSYLSSHTGQGAPYQLLGGLGWGKSIDLTAVASAFDPLGLMQGWAHVMLAVHPVSGRPVLTCYVNDTAVLTNFVGGFVENDSTSHPITDETWPVPFSLVDATDIDTAGSSHNGIGGAEIGSTFFTRGLCLKNCMTEFWFAPGQYIDWSVAGNRALFHDSDLAGLSWTPVNLGRAGATPTGTKPMMYNTGGPAKFPINRATGRPNRVRHDSSYSGGVENILDICDDGGPS